MWLIILQRMSLEFVLDFFRFPLWWYTWGAKRIFFACIDAVKTGNGYIAPGLWFRNLLVPMYGQYDWQGRLVSFFVRLANGIARAAGLVAWMSAVGVFFLLWLAFPLFAAYMFVLSIA